MIIRVIRGQLVWRFVVWWFVVWNLDFGILLEFGFWNLEFPDAGGPGCAGIADLKFEICDLRFPREARAWSGGLTWGVGAAGSGAL